MKNHDIQEQNIIRQIFRSEITWIISIVAGIWGFVSTVVMPIQALQLGQTQIQSQLTKYAEDGNRITKLETNQAVIMSRLQIKDNK